MEANEFAVDEYVNLSRLCAGKKNRRPRERTQPRAPAVGGEDVVNKVHFRRYGSTALVAVGIRTAARVSERTASGGYLGDHYDSDVESPSPFRGFVFGPAAPHPDVHREV